MLIAYALNRPGEERDAITHLGAHDVDITVGNSGGESGRALVSIPVNQNRNTVTPRSDQSLHTRNYLGT